MVLLINVQTLLAGFVFGLGMAICFYAVIPELIRDIRNEEPDNEFLNSVVFEQMFKLGLPVIMVMVSTVIIGPLFGSIYKIAAGQDKLLGVSPEIAFVLGLLVFSLLLDVAVLISKTSFPVAKLAMNTWVFVSLGLLLYFLLHPIVQQTVTT